MSVITLPTSFADGTIPTAAQFNGNFNAIINEFNGNISNANISPTAAIAESKLAFNTSTGHSHNGVNSRLIQVNRAFVWFISGVQATGTNKSVRYIVPEAMTITKAWASVRTAPTTQALIVDINKNGTSIWNATQANRLQIAAAVTTGTQTSFDTTALAAGDYLDLDVDQVGSGTLGSDLTITLETSQP